MSAVVIKGRCAMLAGGLLSAILTTVAAQSNLTLTAPSIVYSEQQAVRGQTLYYERCLICHGETLSGLDQAPPLAGPEFTGVWNGEPLWALVERIDVMPPNDPGRLVLADNVAILAYLLWYNGFPIGDAPLSSERNVLGKISFTDPLAIQ